jgi:hypothetical protein
MTDTLPSPTSELDMIDPGLYDIARLHLGLKPGIDYLDVHPRFRDLATDDLRVGISPMTGSVALAIA